MSEKAENIKNDEVKETAESVETVEATETAVQPVPKQEAKKVTATKTVKKNIWQKLMAIQTVLKAPKNLYNKFGKFHYRNAEGILEAVKPYLAEQECILVIEDQIEAIGSEISKKTTTDGTTMTKEISRRYVKAIAHFIDCETGKEITTSAYANECEHDGQSGDQCTGTASSYARKYCLNALFLLDDTKDSDTDEMKEIENAARKNSAPASEKSFQANKPAEKKTTTPSEWGETVSQKKAAADPSLPPEPPSTAKRWKK